MNSQRPFMQIEEFTLIYEGLCHICGGELSKEEALCGYCVRTQKPLLEMPEDAEVEEFLHLFKKAVGEPRSIQKLWARRILRGESFCSVAGTGMGKTTLSVFASLFLARKEKRSYLLVPTTLLVRQITDTFSIFFYLCPKTPARSGNKQ